MINVNHVDIAVTDLSAPSNSPAFQDFLAYWDGLRGDRFAPSWDEMELIDMPAKVLPNLTVAQVSPDGSDFVFLFCGTGHMTTKARDYTAQSIRSVRPREVAEDMLQQYRRTVEVRRPIAFARTIQGYPEADILKLTTLRLPLSADGERVDGIMSFTDWQAGDDLRDFYIWCGRTSSVDTASVAEPERRSGTG